MKERPILFSSPMVRAILEGRKTQTRRVVKGVASIWLMPEGFTPEFTASPENGLCPYGAPGDTLWVRETWAPSRFKAGDPNYAYRADGEREGVGRWRPSIHMPRCASRLSLRIKSVRVERLQEIGDGDAEAEGAEQIGDTHGAFVAGFAALWDSINAKSHPWASNPWVWVVEFERVTKEVRP